MLKQGLVSLRRHWRKIAAFALLYAVLYTIGFPCLSQFFFHIPCPGCGMTHAVISLLRFDVTGAISYHPMVWSLPILCLYVLYDGRLFRIKRIDLFVLIGIGTGFLIHYIHVLVQNFYLA